MVLYLLETHPDNANRLRSLLKSKHLVILNEFDFSDDELYIFRIGCTIRAFSFLITLSTPSFSFIAKKDVVPKKKITKKIHK